MSCAVTGVRILHGKILIGINKFIPEKAMAPHFSTLAWKIPWTEEPGRLQSMGSLRVGHNWATSLSLFTFMRWRRKWQPTPVFLPGESQGQGSLVGCRLWGHTVGHDWSDLATAAAMCLFILLVFLIVSNYQMRKFPQNNILDFRCYHENVLGDFLHWKCCPNLSTT